MNNVTVKNRQSLERRSLINAHGALELRHAELNVSILGAMREGLTVTLATLRHLRTQVEDDMAQLSVMIERY